VDASWKVLISRGYTYTEGRLSALAIDYAESPPMPKRVRIQFERDGRGAIVATNTDVGDDGSVDQTEDYDLGCWVVHIEGDPWRLKEARDRER